MPKEVTLIVMDFLTVEEVAKELRYSTDTVKKMLRKHEMPGYKIGKEWRVDKAAFEEWLKQQENQYRRPAQEG